MSSYLSFYIRKKDTDIYTPFYSVSRSHGMYTLFYEEFGCHLDEFDRCAPLTSAELNTLYHLAQARIADLKSQIERNEQQKKDIATWNNSVAEKMEALTEIDDFINYCNEEVEFAAFVSNVISFLICVNEEQYGCGHPIVYAGIDGREPNAEEKKLNFWGEEIE